LGIHRRRCLRHDSGKVRLAAPKCKTVYELHVAFFPKNSWHPCYSAPSGGSPDDSPPRTAGVRREFKSSILVPECLSHNQAFLKSLPSAPLRDLRGEIRILGQKVWIPPRAMLKVKAGAPLPANTRYNRRCPVLRSLSPFCGSMGRGRHRVPMCH
jgi:hypothetical protein